MSFTMRHIVIYNRSNNVNHTDPSCTAAQNYDQSSFVLPPIANPPIANRIQHLPRRGLRQRLFTYTLLFGLMLAIFAAMSDLAAQTAWAKPHGQQSDSLERTLGTVTQKPDGDTKYGSWEFDSNGTILHLEAVAGNSFFLTTVPQVNDTVYVTYQPKTGNSGTLISLMKMDVETINTPEVTSNLIRVVLHGSVSTATAATDGIGTWQIYNDNGSIYSVDVYTTTAFIKGIPQQGNEVYVSGWQQANKNVSADTITIDDGTIQMQEIEQRVTKLSGEVVDAPTELAEGKRWRIRRDTIVYMVDSDSETVFYPNIPEPGTYVDLLLMTTGVDTPQRIVTMDVNTHVLGEIVVRLQPGAAITTITTGYNLQLTEVVLASADIYRLTTRNPTPPYLNYMVKQLEENQLVLWADLNYVGELPIAGNPHRTWGWGGADDESYINQAALTQIHLADVHATYSGKNQRIAVLDTGIDLRHPALQPYILYGFDFVSNDNLPDDEGPGMAQGHGTHVSGIALRVAPQSQILPLRVLDADGRGNLLHVVKAIEWAVDNHAKVINLSLGTEEDSPLLHEAIHWATEQGVSVVAAAGNDNTDTWHYPAAYTETVAVTAVAHNLQKASFANYGAWIDLAAPGVGITSTIVTEQGSGYAAWSGTSMATPFVSGAAALVHEKYTEMSTAEVKSRLIERGDLVNALGVNYPVGAFLNVQKSLQDDAPPPTPEPKQFIYLPFVVTRPGSNVDIALPN